MEILNKINNNLHYEEATVLVISKTKVQNHNISIEVITSNGQNLRLIYLDNPDIYNNFDINIYDNLFIKYQNLTTSKQPHTENINVVYIKKISRNNTPMLDILHKLDVNVVHGSPSILFDNKLEWLFDSWTPRGYISDNIPDYSIQYWISDKDLYLNGNKYTYTLDKQIYSIQYNGLHKPQDCIYKGTLIKVSLSNWTKSNSSEESRCYLELAEYYPSENEKDILSKITSSIEDKTMLLT